MPRSVLVFAICAMFLGLGLGRFAFSPLMPELVRHGIMAPEAAQSIAAANLVGYLAGAMLAEPALRLIPERGLCLTSAALVPLSYAMFLLPLGVEAYWLARFLAGLGGAILMIVATAAAGRRLAALNQRRLQPLVFLGIGLGVLFAAVLLPPLLRSGVQASIAALALLAAVVFAAFRASSGFLADDSRPLPAGEHAARASGLGVALIIAAYGCDALGFVMHTVYLPDMLRRDHGYSEAQIGMVWAAFGFGAGLAPLYALLIRRVLAQMTSLWASLVVKAPAVFLVTLNASPPCAGLSLFLFGMLSPGLVILISGALAARLPPDRYRAAWAWATFVFAFCQMASGLLIAGYAGRNYPAALLLSALVLLAGAGLCLASERLRTTRRMREA